MPRGDSRTMLDAEEVVLMADAPGASSDDTLRSALAALLPEFRARATEGERLRTMPSDLVRRARAGGLFRLNLPRSLGGLELDPATTAEIFEEISHADGSAGWTIVIGNSTAFLGGAGIGSVLPVRHHRRDLGDRVPGRRT